MAAAVTDRTKVVLVCTPNNPTGPGRDAPPSWRRFLAAVPGDVLVVVDEAYVEFVRDPEAASGLDALAAAPQRRGAADVLQGVRAGRSAGRLRDRAARRSPTSIRKATPPFTVTDLSQAAAVASLEAQASPRRAGRGRSCRSAIAMLAALRAQGWDVPGHAGQLRVAAAGRRRARLRGGVRAGLGAPVPGRGRAHQHRRAGRSTCELLARAAWRGVARSLSALRWITGRRARYRGP